MLTRLLRLVASYTSEMRERNEELRNEWAEVDHSLPNRRAEPK